MIHFRNNKLFFCLIFILFIATISFYSCQNQPQTAKEKLENEVTQGGILAKQYCTRCHLYPDPALLDKTTWERGVLPAMAKQLGLNEYMGQVYAVKTSAISTSEWVKIAAFYKSISPAKLDIPAPPKSVKNDWAIFSLKKPHQTDTTKPALTTFVGFNPADQQIYSADAGNNLYRWNSRLNPKLAVQLPSPATDIIWDNNQKALITCIGTLPPSDVLNGRLLYYNFLKKDSKPIIYADNLPRAVQTVAADFDKDGLIDYAICGFGHDRGGLFLVKQTQGLHFKTIPIRSIPGATQLITGDFNNDGWPDLMCLFAQADEGIWMFLNNQKGGFMSKNILHFPPIYGSSSFQLVDFNHDNKPDILYTAGDNSDYSRVLKPYHGVYIFINDGNFNFKKQYFYHIDGCTKAIAADFKHQGNLDIAVISFFADFKDNPSEGFEYLEQDKPLHFTPHQIPVNHDGRWLTMNVCDYNHDGFPDIILGNFSMGGGLINQKNFKPDWDMHTPLIVLENTLGKRSK